ncbi:hypothetical protein K8S19_11775 [bacterium]|nr:hypothetical protein [bacterium]
MKKMSVSPIEQKSIIPLFGYAVKMFFLIFCLSLLSAPGHVSAKQFVDNLSTDFYAGKDDNIQIGQNLDGDLKLAPYAMLGNWATVSGPSNTSLYLSSATTYNGKIYLSGGYGSDDSTSFGGPTVANSLNKIWYGTVFSDGSVDEWKEADDTSVLPQPTYGHTSTVVNGRYYIIGGRSTADTTLSAVYWARILGHDGTIKAHYKSNTWTAVASLPQAIFRAKSAYFEGRIYVIGGQDGSNIAQNTVYYADVQPSGDIWSWRTTTAPLPINISGHCATISNGNIYVLGGSTTGEPLDTTADVYVGAIDITTGDIAGWTQTTSLPEPMYAASATISAGKIWVAGGQTSGNARADVFYARLEPPNGLIPGPGARDTWSRSTDLPIEVYNHNLVSFNGHLFLIGGYNSTGIQNMVYTSTLATPKTNISRWVPTTPLFRSAYGGNIYDTWGGHSGVLRVPLPGDDVGTSSSSPMVFVIGGGPNTFSAYAGGIHYTTDTQPSAYSTVYNSEVDTNGSLQTWAAPDTGGSIPMASILHASTIANGAIYVVGGANSMNAWIWAGAASRSVTAAGVGDSLGRPTQAGRTVVMYEEVGQGSASSGVGSFEFTASLPIYDPAWEAGGASGYTSNTALPIYQPLIRHTTVAHNGNIYVMGGISRQNNGWNAAGEPAGESTPVFEDRVWFCRPNPGGTINEVGGAGGWTETAPLSNPPSAAPSISSRYDMAACVAYNRVYLFGGRDAAGVPQDQIFYAQINSDATLNDWEEMTLSPLPEALAEHQVVFMNGKFYVIGGVNNSGTLRNTVYYCTLDPTTGRIPAFPNPGSWALSNTTLEYAVAGHSSVGDNGFLYVLGGRYNMVDPHTSSAYMTSIIDMFQDQDIVYAWQGTYERFIDLDRDQLIEMVGWDGNENMEIMDMKCRYAIEKGCWSDWTIPQAIGPFTVQQFARYIHYKVFYETRTNDRTGIARSPSINRVYVDYAESKRIGNDSFQINHNKFDPQIDQLLITYKTRDHSVANIIIRVYNLEGELIKRQDIDIPAGVNLPATGSWIWDGTNENSEIVANGVYIIQYNSGNTHKTRKVVVFKQ